MTPNSLALDFSQACLRGKLVDAFEHCHRLTHLNLSNNKLRGPRVLEAFKALSSVGPQLVRLSLAGNALSGVFGGVNKVLNDEKRQYIDSKGPTEKCTMMELQKEGWTEEQAQAGALRFAKKKKKDIQDRLSGKPTAGDDAGKKGKREPGVKSTTAEIFAMFSSLEVLALCHMDLEGVIHENMGKHLTSLRQLWLNSNHISEKLPESFSNLTQLELFDVSDNALDGPTLPHTIELLGGCRNRLRTLNLSGNPLGGELPEQLCGFTELSELKLNDMRLEGHIPSDLSRLARLKILFLFNNRLTGSIPASVTALTELRELHLSNNQLVEPPIYSYSYASELYLQRKLPKCRVLGTDDLELAKIRRKNGYAVEPDS